MLFLFENDIIRVSGWSFVGYAFATSRVSLCVVRPTGRIFLSFQPVAFPAQFTKQTVFVHQQSTFVVIARFVCPFPFVWLAAAGQWRFMFLGKFLRVSDGQTTNAADYWFRIDEVSGFLIHFLAPNTILWQIADFFNI